MFMLYPSHEVTWSHQCVIKVPVSLSLGRNMMNVHVHESLSMHHTANRKTNASLNHAGVQRHTLFHHSRDCQLTNTGPRSKFTSLVAGTYFYQGEVPMYNCVCHVLKREEKMAKPYQQTTIPEVDRGGSKERKSGECKSTASVWGSYKVLTIQLIKSPLSSQPPWPGVG